MAAGAGVSGESVEAGREARRETINRAGDVASCASARPDDAGPPAGCGALVRVGLEPLRLARRIAPPADEGPAHAAEPTEASPAAVGSSSEAPSEPAGEETSLARSIDPAPPRPAPDAPTPPREPGGLSVWGWIPVGVLAAALTGAVIAGAVVAANKEEAPRPERPTGGLGSAPLSGAQVRW